MREFSLVLVLRVPIVAHGPMHGVLVTTVNFYIVLITVYSSGGGQRLEVETQARS